MLQIILDINTTHRKLKPTGAYTYLLNILRLCLTHEKQISWFGTCIWCSSRSLSILVLSRLTSAAVSESAFAITTTMFTFRCSRLIISRSTCRRLFRNEQYNVWSVKRVIFVSSYKLTGLSVNVGLDGITWKKMGANKNNYSYFLEKLWKLVQSRKSICWTHRTLMICGWTYFNI